MPRRRNRRDELDFEIHVDSSCTPPADADADMDDSFTSPSATPDFSEIGAGGFADEDDHSSMEPNWVTHEDTDDGGGDDADATEHTVLPSIEEDETLGETGSRRESGSSRRSSVRSNMRDQEEDLRQSTLRSTHQARVSNAASDDSYGSFSPINSLGAGSEGCRSTGGRSQPSGGEDSGSHRDEQDDDVFSDDSPRSSMGSMPEADQHKMDNHAADSRRSTTSRISDIQPYNPDEEFVPSVRAAPRPSYRSPSSFQNTQIHSPPPSVTDSPRSGRNTPRRSTMPKLGSPSTNLSPKKTTPRVKRHTPPLVLLHVTLLPLRWPWGDLLDSVRPSELSEAGKALREAWRQVQDRIGDTVCDRGILLPHPQNDFEILEERLLEAVELPLRRRARILECGHYLGAANEMTLEEEMDSEDDEEFEARMAAEKSKTHWCSTCQSDIRYDSLGEGRVFRTKVYASNGLMRAGAWDACWKQMERVDVEVEPIVDEAVLDELEHLATEQHIKAQEEEEQAIEAERSLYDIGSPHDAQHFSSPPPQPEYEETPLDEERMIREEERLREIYGQPPPPPPPEAEAEPSSAPQPETYMSPETPPSPSVEALERRESRRQAYKSASLPELVLEAAKVLLQDRRNIALAVLGVLVMMLAVRGGQEPVPLPLKQSGVQHEEYAVAREHPAEKAAEKQAGGDPCAPCSIALEAARASCAGGPVTVTVTETLSAPTVAATEHPQAEVEEASHSRDQDDVEAADYATDQVEVPDSAPTMDAELEMEPEVDMDIGDEMEREL